MVGGAPKWVYYNCQEPIPFPGLFVLKECRKRCCKKTLRNNCLPNGILGKNSMHTDVCQIYKQEVCLEALYIILLPLLSNIASIVNMYGGGALSLLALVN